MEKSSCIFFTNAGNYYLVRLGVVVFEKLDSVLVRATTYNQFSMLVFFFFFSYFNGQRLYLAAVELKTQEGNVIHVYFIKRCPLVPLQLMHTNFTASRS